MPRGGEVAVQKGMERPLAAAAGTVVAGEIFHDTARRIRLHRIVAVVISHHGGDGCHYCNSHRRRGDYLTRLHHSPDISPMSMAGRNPSAIAIMMSHAVISDALRDLARLPEL